jgi:hypothetical protein
MSPSLAEPLLIMRWICCGVPVKQSPYLAQCSAAQRTYSPGVCSLRPSLSLAKNTARPR